MNATTHAATTIEARFARPASGTGVASRYVVTVGDTSCEVRAHTIAMIAEVLGFEQEMEGDVVDLMTGDAADGRTIADLLDSRMIAPPRPLRRRQRPVSSRAVFYGAAGK